MNDPILDRLLPLVAKSLGWTDLGGLDRATRLADLTMDSVVTLELLLSAEQEFQVELDAQDLLQGDAFATLGGLADFIASRSATKG